MATNPDFKDLFSALCAAGAEFLVVGAHAGMFFTRATRRTSMSGSVHRERTPAVCIAHSRASEHPWRI